MKSKSAMFKRSTHIPAHPLIDDTPYFITAATCRKQYLPANRLNADVKISL